MRVQSSWLVAVLLAGCGSTTAHETLGSGTTGGHPSASISSGGTSGGITAIGATGVGAAGSSGTAAAATVGGSSGTHGSAVSTAGATGGSTSSVAAATTSGASSGGTTGACFMDGQYPGANNAAGCCSGTVDGSGYCTAAGATAATAGSIGTTAGSTGTTGGTSTTNGATSGGSSGASDICNTQRCTVYAQTGTDLYTIDPTSLAQTHVAAFGGDLSGESVFDIAVRADGLIFAITATDLYSVDPNTGVGTHLASLGTSTVFNSLTFTLGGTLLAADATAGEVDEISPSNGTITPVGSYGNGLVSSGDLVALSTGVIYATATDGIDADVLVTLDPTHNYAATTIGSTGFYSIYGLAYWAGVLYGFDAAGDVITIVPSTGTGTLVSNNAFQWYGAGTTPQAPVIDK